MFRIGRAAACGFFGGVLLLTAGCAGQPTVVPAGSAGLEVPAEGAATAATAVAAAGTAPLAAPGGTPRAASPRPGQAVARAAVGQQAADAGKAAPDTPRSAGLVPRATGQPAAGPDERGAAPGRVAQTNGRPAGPVAPRVAGGKAPAAAGSPAGSATLPAAGTYAYRLSGTSSLGPPPRSSTLTIADAGSGAQLWTLDSRRADGAGMIEELQLTNEDAGVFVSAYRLDASTGIAGVILEFNPLAPVLLTPANAKVGTTWPFDLGTSADGCAAAKGFGEVLDPGAGTSTRLFRLTTTLITVGPALCVALEGERTQEIRHPADSFLPTEIDSDMRGRVGGAPFTATTRAVRQQDAAARTPAARTPDSQRPGPSVPGRGRP